MNLSSLADLVTVVSYPLLIGAFVISIKQTGELRRSNEAMVYQHIAGLMVDIDKLFVERPELRPYFYANRPIPHDAELRARADSMAELVLDFLDSYVAQESGISSRVDKGNWDRYIVELFESSPVLRSFYRSYPHWYGGRLKELADPVVNRRTRRPEPDRHTHPVRRA